MINPGQGVDHRVYRVKKKETRLNASVYFDASLIIQPRVLGYFSPSTLPLTTYLLLCTYSPHISILRGSFILLTHLFIDTLPFPRCLLSLVLCLSHTISSRISISISIHHHTISVWYRFIPSHFVHLVDSPRSECHTIYIHLPLPPVHPISTSTPISSRLHPQLESYARCQWTLKMRGYLDTRLLPLLRHP